VDTTVVCC